MDRLRTGRRRRRAGSVTVRELLSKQVSAAPCTDSSPATEDVTDAIPVIVPVTRRHASVSHGQFAKLASLGVAGVVLCTAIAVSTAIASHRRNSGQTGPAPVITGEQALLPGKLTETLPGQAVPAAPPSSSTRPAEEPSATPPAAGTPAPPLAQGGQAGGHSDDAGGTSASASDNSSTAASDLELVREFYDHLPDCPVAAFGLVADDLLHTSLREFLDAWATVRSIESVDLTERADGVLATVRMRMTDGGHLRIQQLLTVAESPRRITGVQLLSAQNG